MKVLIVGSGGREHALAWKIAKAPGSRVSSAPRGTAGRGSWPRMSPSPIPTSPAWPTSPRRRGSN